MIVYYEEKEISLRLHYTLNWLISYVNIALSIFKF